MTPGRGTEPLRGGGGRGGNRNIPAATGTGRGGRFVKRVYVCLTAFAAAVAGTVTAGSLSAQPPAGGGAGAAAAAPARGAAVFNVAKVMKDYQKWQFFAAAMNKERANQAQQLATLRGQIVDL